MEPGEAGRAVQGLSVKQGDDESLGRCNGTRMGRGLREATVWIQTAGAESRFTPL